MKIIDEIVGKVTVLQPQGLLDFVAADSLKNKVKNCAMNGQFNLVIDMSKVTLVDSSGMGSLVACLRVIKKEGGDIRIYGIKDQVRALFELIRLHHIFEIFDSVSAAIESFQRPGK